MRAESTIGDGTAQLQKLWVFLVWWENHAVVINLHERLDKWTLPRWTGVTVHTDGFMRSLWSSRSCHWVTADHLHKAPEMPSSQCQRTRIQCAIKPQNLTFITNTVGLETLDLRGPNVWGNAISPLQACLKGVMRLNVESSLHMLNWNRKFSPE